MMLSRLAAKCSLGLSLIFALTLWTSDLWLDAWSLAHDVGEPELKKLGVWKQCCGNGDCFPKTVKMLSGRAEGNKVVVRIDGTEASVDKEKFSPVPSTRTWVCYLVPNGTISNENIRCILYPEKGGTT